MTTDRPDHPAPSTPPGGQRRDSVRVLAPRLVAMSDDEHAAAVDALAALCLWALRGGGRRT